MSEFTTCFLSSLDHTVSLAQAFVSFNLQPFLNVYQLHEPRTAWAVSVENKNEGLT